MGRTLVLFRHFAPSYIVTDRTERPPIRAIEFSGTPLRILIVEDDAMLAFAMEEMLTTGGHEVVGLAREEQLAFKISVSQKPDLALVDFALARGSSGADAARNLHERCGVPSVFVSATPGDCRKALPATGTLGCLRKPFVSAELNGAVAVAEALIRGEAVGLLPSGMELYAQT